MKTERSFVQADMRAHEARAAWFAEVERVVKGE